MPKQPILLNACARAATAAEAAFRLPILERSSWRHTRVVALDQAAAEIVNRIGADPWHGARFFTTGGAPDPSHGPDRSGEEEAGDVVLDRIGGSASRLDAELDGADLVVLVATVDDGAAAASAIGMACALRGIMTAGLVLDEGPRTDAVVSALRPHARVLMVTQDEQDVAEVLLALRA